MKFLIAFILCMSSSVFAKTKNVSTLSIEETNALCPLLGNWSGIYTRGEAFLLECSPPQAKVTFNAFRSNPTTQISFNRSMVSAFITDESECYDIYNSVGSTWRSWNLEIICKERFPGSPFADWCRITKFRR